MHEDVQAAWDRAVEDWTDEARHAALLGLVAQHNCYAWAAARYKERAPDAIAERQLDRLRRAATATLLATATARPSSEDTPYKKTVLVFVALVAFVVLGLLFAKLIHDNRPAPVTKPARP